MTRKPLGFFSRACVRESLAHGKENEPFLQREDVRRSTTGSARVTKPEVYGPLQSVYGAAEALRCAQRDPRV